MIVALVLAAAALGVAAPARAGSRRARVLLVGTFQGRRGSFASIQAAVDAAQPGDWILIGPGDHHEQGDHRDPASSSAVMIRTPHLHLRGMDRNRVVVDGTKPGASQCSAAPADQDVGRAGADGRGAGRNGIEVLKADGVSIENLTVCNFLNGSAGGGNEIWWNGGDGTGRQELGAFHGSYLSATSTYFRRGSGDAEYGIFASNVTGPGTISHTYTSNMADAGYYIGACPDCNTALDHAHAQYSALGYSGTNSGGHVTISNSEFDHNKAGVSTNSQNNDDAPSPEDGTCPVGGVGRTGTHSCWLFARNNVHDNNNAHVPSTGTAALAPVGTGIVIAGGRNDTVVDNRFANNASWAVLVIPFVDTDRPPPIAHCDGGTANYLQTGWCYYAGWGNEVARNSFSRNGALGNPTNGDLAELSDAHDPGNCWHDNADPAGVTTAPPRLQATNQTCGAPHAGAAILMSALSDQVVCATEILGSCPPTRGKHYPRLARPEMPALRPQRTMPDPCRGVPSNAWCNR
jgi:hypothetical protein